MDSSLKTALNISRFSAPFLRTRHPKIEDYITFDYKIPLCSANQEGLKKVIHALKTNNTAYLNYFKAPEATNISVITEADLCMGCGTCGMACPTNAITFINQRPKIDTDVCIKCGACFIQCPRSFFNTAVLSEQQFGSPGDPLTGYYKEVYTARTQNEAILKKSQDGGIVTDLLCYLLETNTCDAAVVSLSKNGWDTLPAVVTTPEEVLKAAGTKYTVVPNLTGIKDAADKGFKKIAFVGVPCQTQGVAKTNVYPLGDRYYRSKIAFVISIFCMENFLFGNLRSIVEGKTEVRMGDVNKMGISRGRFWVTSRDGNRFRVPVKYIKEYAQKSCSVCLDFTGELSDISVGGVGSPDGYCTVLVRSEKGKKVFDDFKKRIEHNPLSEQGLAAIHNLAAVKKSENARNIEKREEKKERVTLL